MRSVLEKFAFFGMMSIGTNPTVGGTEKTIETYFFDFEGDLYGKHLKIELLTRIRDEKKFESVEGPKIALKQDRAFSMQYIKDNYAE